MKEERVVILLGLFNGASTLELQLESLAQQTHTNWSLIVSDDGSTDDSRKIVREFAARHQGHDIQLVDGPRNGFEQNFLSLLKRVPPECHVAFCDQDDAWLPDKLGVGLKALAQLPHSQPAAYCGRTLYCDDNMRPLRPSPMFHRPPEFRNALVQSIAGANTFILNPAAIQLLQAAEVPSTGIVSHDWWAYQMITGVGGSILFDPDPKVRYRLHGGNLVGANDTPGAVLSRLYHVTRGRFKSWNSVNIAALLANEDVLTDENKQVLRAFQAVHSNHPLKRLAAVRHSGVFRQSRLQTPLLWFFAALGRL